MSISSVTTTTTITTTRLGRRPDWHGDWYQMRVDRCTASVDRLHRVHRTMISGNFDYGHFNFTFNF